MGAVAIVALNQALGNPVVEGSSELRANILVAGVAKLRRLGLHQELVFLGVMRVVAIDAGDAIGQVHGAIVITVLFGVLVATEAARASLLGSGVLKGEDLGFIAAAVDVGFAWTVAGLTTMPFHALMGIELGFQGGREVGSLLETRGDFIMTRLACIRADIQSGIGWRVVLGNFAVGRFRLLCCMPFIARAKRRDGDSNKE